MYTNFNSLKSFQKIQSDFFLLLNKELKKLRTELELYSLKLEQQKGRNRKYKQELKELKEQNELLEEQLEILQDFFRASSVYNYEQDCI